jgi:hypothetical protein
MKAANWCRDAVQRLVPASPLRVGLFCAVLALATMRCISDFVVTPQPPAGSGAATLRLALLNQPAPSMPGAPLAQALRVAIRNVDGEPATEVRVTVTVQLLEAPPGATLGGQRNAPAVAGEARFTDLRFDSAGDYRLLVVSGNLVPDTSHRFTVRWPDIDDVDILPHEVQLTALGAGVQLAARVRDDDGGTIVGAPIRWSSSDTAVVVVDQSGALLARGDGKAQVRAEVLGVRGTADVAVRQAVATLAIEPPLLTLGLYQARIVEARATDSNGFPVMRALNVSWASNKDRSVTVAPAQDRAFATVRRWRTGTAIITATLEGKSGTLTVQ